MQNGIGEIRKTGAIHHTVHGLTMSGTERKADQVLSGIIKLFGLVITLKIQALFLMGHMAYGIWGQFAVIMDQGTGPKVGPGHIWFSHASPAGYGAY